MISYCDGYVSGHMFVFRFTDFCNSMFRIIKVLLSIYRYCEKYVIDFILKLLKNGTSTCPNIPACKHKCINDWQ